MGLRQVLGYLSEESGRDENLLSSQERELLTNILKQAKASSADPRLVSTVESILARAIGDTLLQRASEAAGRSLLGTLESLLSSGKLAEQTNGVFVGPGPETGPRPPSPSGPGPGPKARGGGSSAGFFELTSTARHRAETALAVWARTTSEHRRAGRGSSFWCRSAGVVRKSSGAMCHLRRVSRSGRTAAADGLHAVTRRELPGQRGDFARRCRRGHRPGIPSFARTDGPWGI